MKWFWILGVLLGAGGPVRAQMDSVAIRLEKIKTATEDSVRLEYAGEIELYGLRLSVVIGLKSL